MEQMGKGEKDNEFNFGQMWLRYLLDTHIEMSNKQLDM